MPRLTSFARPLDGSARQFDPIIRRIGDARTVLIGEATHGTHEFYRARAALTRQLIGDLDFAAVVVEGDWPDAYRVNRYVRAEGDDPTAQEALGDFHRFPSWMWRNRVVEEFVTWLRYRNDNHRPEDRAGFYGMDLGCATVDSSNARDHQVMDTYEALREHLATDGAGDKLVIWAHNSHVGDARATEWRHLNQISLGQLMRERHGHDDVVLIGLSTHTGTVTAARSWDEPAELAQLRPSLRGSWERTLHEVGLPRLFVSSREAGDVLDEERLTRAIGVIYQPETERASHYYGSRIGRQFDVILHYDETRALQPLERRHVQESLREPAEIYPFGV
jgi:erythromycin esterase-like protein